MWSHTGVRDDFPHEVNGGEHFVTKRTRTGRAVRVYWTKMKLLLVTDLTAERVWKAMEWVEKNGDVPRFAALWNVMVWTSAV